MRDNRAWAAVRGPLATRATMKALTTAREHLTTQPGAKWRARRRAPGCPARIPKERPGIPLFRFAASPWRRGDAPIAERTAGTVTNWSGQNQELPLPVFRAGQGGGLCPAWPKPRLETAADALVGDPSCTDTAYPWSKHGACTNKSLETRESHCRRQVRDRPAPALRTRTRPDLRGFTAHGARGHHRA